MNEGWGLVGVVVTCLFGGGGIVGVLNWKLAKRRGVREDEREDDNAVALQMKIIIDAQLESLVKPLQEDVNSLREELRQVRQEVEQQKNKYWKVVGYARALLYWIERTFPHHGHTVPVPSDTIRHDIEIG